MLELTKAKRIFVDAFRKDLDIYNRKINGTLKRIDLYKTKIDELKELIKNSNNKENNPKKELTKMFEEVYALPFVENVFYDDNILKVICKKTDRVNGTIVLSFVLTTTPIIIEVEVVWEKDKGNAKRYSYDVDRKEARDIWKESKNLAIMIMCLYESLLAFLNL